MGILTTQVKPTSIDAWILGYHVARDAGKVRRYIGYALQEFSVWSDLTGTRTSSYTRSSTELLETDVRRWFGVCRTS